MRIWSANEQPQSNEGRLSPFADMIPQIVWEAQPDGNYTDFNRRWYEYTGLTRESSLGTGWIMAIHPEDRAPCIERWQQTIETGQPFEIEYRLRGAQDEYRWFLSRAIPDVRSRGRDRCLGWRHRPTFMIIEETQEEFQRGEAKFRLLAGAIPQMVWMADVRWGVHYLNQQWYDYTGRDRRGIAGLGVAPGGSSGRS